jgi:hypothetical protein
VVCLAGWKGEDDEILEVFLQVSELHSTGVSLMPFPIVPSLTAFWVIFFQNLVEEERDDRFVEPFGGY